MITNRANAEETEKDSRASEARGKRNTKKTLTQDGFERL